MFGWEPGIGDPTVYGWVTVAAYALGALFCWQASRSGAPREQRFWLVLTAIMAFLCVNKQLDLVLTREAERARDLALACGLVGRGDEVEDLLPRREAGGAISRHCVVLNARPGQSDNLGGEEHCACSDGNPGSAIRPSMGG